MPPSPSAAARGTMIAAPASHQGKTVVTAALARALVRRGESVRIVKLGPDYLDPTILERACGAAVYNLDEWIMGEAHCRRILFEAARAAGVVLLEGVMGVHDNTPSNAALSRRFGIPATLVMDLSRNAQTAVALVHGLRCHAGGFTLAGVVGNRIGSDHHHTLVAEAFDGHAPYFGSIRRDPRMALPERHLGLVQGAEIADLDARLDAAADCLEACGVAVELPSLHFDAPASDDAVEHARLLDGVRIAVARDRAFGFVYPANLHCLASLGATLVFFSPLADEPVPDCDALWLPGGYPELHGARLAANGAARESVRAHCAAGRPVLAECGGMMYLSRSITGVDGDAHAMCGVIDAEFTMHARFQGIGHQQARIGGHAIRGHAFHHSRMQGAIAPSAFCTRADGSRGEALFVDGRLTMGYAHLYFPSGPAATASLFDSSAAR